MEECKLVVLPSYVGLCWHRTFITLIYFTFILIWIYHAQWLRPEFHTSTCTTLRNVEDSVVIWTCNLWIRSPRLYPWTTVPLRVFFQRYFNTWNRLPNFVEMSHSKCLILTNSGWVLILTKSGWVWSCLQDGTVQMERISEIEYYVNMCIYWHRCCLVSCPTKIEQILQR